MNRIFFAILVLCSSFATFAGARRPIGNRSSTAKISPDGNTLARAT